MGRRLAANLALGLEERPCGAPGGCGGREGGEGGGGGAGGGNDGGGNGAIPVKRRRRKTILVLRQI